MPTGSKVTALKSAKQLKSALKPPKHLRKKGRELWESVTTDFELEHHDLVVLLGWCETLDLRTAAEKQLRDGSLTIENRHGELKPHPLIAVIRDCNTTIARLRRELALTEEPEDSRPPRLRYGGPK